MTVFEVQSDRDRLLRERLEKEPAVQRVLEHLARAPDLVGTRRHFLARALRLSKDIAPDLHAMLEAARQQLAIDIEVELFVYPAAEFNAACARPERGRVFLLFSAALLEAFDPGELAFVLGHELGHFIYDHHGLPLGALLHEQSGVPARTALELFAWQRYAEISADRAGLLVAGSLDPAARALFKLSSGLRTAPGPAEIAAFVDQARDLYEEVEDTRSTEAAPHSDWMSSHPFSPIRLQAARAFADTSHMGGDRALADVEVEVSESMRLMEPGYLDEDSDAAEAMRRYLFAAGVVLAGVHRPIDPREIDTLRSLLGAGRVPDKVNPELLVQHLEARAAQVRDKVSPGRRAQVIRDLALVAKADEQIHPDERSFLSRCATSLGVPTHVAEQALGEAVELD